MKMKGCLTDPLEWLFPDCLNSVPRTPFFQADVPQGGVASVNVVLQDVPEETLMRFHALLPQDCDGWKIELFRLQGVPVKRNTGLYGFCENAEEPNTFVTRRAPFCVYDIMEPLSRTSFRVPPGSSAYQIRMEIPGGAKAGIRDIQFSFNHESVVFRVVVWDVPLVPCGRNSVMNTNWWSWDNIVHSHELENDSPAFYRMLKKYASIMYAARSNTALIPLRMLFTRDEKTGELELNRGKLRRIVKIFTEAGIYYLEGSPFGHRANNEWLSPDFQTIITDHRVDTEAANRDIASMASQLMHEIVRNQWQDRYFQHAADEPISVNAVSYRILVGLIRKYMPGIPILEAMSDPEAPLAGAVNISCPQVQCYENNREHYEDTRLQGDQIWLYTCCMPGGRYLNRLLDGELLRPTLLGWGCAYYRVNGFLHWGLNCYKSGSDPFQETTPQHGKTNFLPPGDTHIVYPGARGPWPSVRMEAQRTGLEDWEMIRVLQRKNAALADRIVAEVFRKFNDYTACAGAYRTARRKLLSALSEQTRK